MCICVYIVYVYIHIYKWSIFKTGILYLNHDMCFHSYSLSRMTTECQRTDRDETHQAESI